MPRRRKAPSRATTELRALPGQRQIMAYLQATYAMTRPPIITARMLAYILHLHKYNQAFPIRTDVAEAVGCTVSAVDKILSMSLARELITIEVAAVDNTHEGVWASEIIQQRYCVPSDVLIEAAQEPLPVRRVA